MIIETAANQTYCVTEHTDAALSHVWLGVAVKKSRGVWVSKANAREQLVRKAGCKVIQVQQ